MNLFFNNIKFSSLSISPNSNIYNILIYLQNSTVSKNIDEIASYLKLDVNIVSNELKKLRAAGLIYEERDGHFNLTRYGHELTTHVSDTNKEVSHNVPQTTSYNRILKLLKTNGNIPKSNLRKTDVSTINSLVNSGYLIDNGDSYVLSNYGKIHSNYYDEINKITKEKIEKAYEHFKLKHPEYQYVYKFLDVNAVTKSVFIEDIKNIINGAKIDDIIPDPNTRIITKKWWGFEPNDTDAAIPPHSSIEDAIAAELRYMIDLVKHIRENVPSMKDIKSAREYVYDIKKNINPNIVNDLLRQYYKGTVLNNTDILTLGSKIINRPFPSNLDSSSVLSMLNKLIQDNRDLMNTGVFLPTDSSEVIVDVLYHFLKNGQVYAFNNFQSSHISSQGIIQDLFVKYKDFSNLDLYGIVLKDLSDIENVNFSNSILDDCKIKLVLFSNCNFENSKIRNASLNDISFVNCVLKNTDFEGTSNLNSIAFKNNIGNPINAFYTTNEISADEFNVAVNQPVKTHYVSLLNEEDKQIAKILIDNLRNFLYKTASLLKRFHKLSFVVFADAKEDILNLLNPSKPIAQWLSKDTLINMIKSGELAKLGIDPKIFPKLIGRISQYEKQKEESMPKSRYEELSESYPKEKLKLYNFEKVLSNFIESNQGYLINRKNLEEIIPSESIRGIIESYGTTRDGVITLTPHDLEEIIIQLNRAVSSISNDSSEKVYEFRKKLNNFSYTSRISTIKKSEYSDRGGISREYPNTFGLILEPSTFGVTDPNLRKMINQLDIHTTWRENSLHPSLGHWQHAIASSRIQPHVITTNDLASDTKTIKKVWVIVELQSDPNQKRIYNLFTVFDKNFKLPNFKLNSNIHYLLDTLYNLSKSTGKLETNDFAKHILNDSRLLNIAIDSLFKKSTGFSLDDFKSVIRMLLHNKSIPASFLLIHPEVQNKKRFLNGEQIAEFLIEQNIISPILSNDNYPIFEENGVKFNKYQVNEQSLNKKLFDSFLDTYLLNELINTNMVDYKNNKLELTEYGKETSFIFNQLSKFRKHYKDWPEMLILEAINRAIDAGIDEIWIPTAKDFSRSSKGQNRDLEDYYDEPAKKFTNKIIKEPFEIRDDGSALWSNVTSDYYPSEYYVIDISQWKPQIKRSSMKKLSAKYTNFVNGFIESIIRQYPYLSTLPTEVFAESAIAFLIEKNKIEADANTLNKVKDDIFRGLNVNVPYYPVNYVKILVNIKANIDKNIHRLIRKTGEEPIRLSKDIVEGVLERGTFSNLTNEEKEKVVHLFNELVQNDYDGILGAAQQTYDEVRQTGTSDGGSELVPAGEERGETTGEEDISEVDKLIQKQQEESKKEKKQEVLFEPPSEREQRNLLQEQIDILLDKLREAKTEEEKRRIEKRLMELSKLTSLTFNRISKNSKNVFITF